MKLHYIQYILFDIIQYYSLCFYSIIVHLLSDTKVGTNFCLVIFSVIISSKIFSSYIFQLYLVVKYI